MKLCKDCKHALIPTGLNAMAGDRPRCGHPDMPSDPVYGMKTVYCSTARAINILPPFDICAYEGKHYEEAPPLPEEPKLETKPYVLPDVAEAKKNRFDRILGG